MKKIQLSLQQSLSMKSKRLEAGWNQVYLLKILNLKV